MVDASTPTYLRRYTDLPALLNMLSMRQITLLDPKTWDDRNDSFFMSLYKERKKLKTLLALCFAQTPETYHHWRVFSNGSAGVCVVFDRAALLDSVLSCLSRQSTSGFVQVQEMYPREKGIRGRAAG